MSRGRESSGSPQFSAQLSSHMHLLDDRVEQHEDRQEHEEPNDRGLRAARELAVRVGILCEWCWRRRRAATPSCPF